MRVENRDQGIIHASHDQRRLADAVQPVDAGPAHERRELQVVAEARPPAHVAEQFQRSPLGMRWPSGPEPALWGGTGRPVPARGRVAIRVREQLVMTLMRAPC